MYRLADRLHKTVAEIEQMTLSEFNGWLAYARILQERQANG
jgi:hypothetical protein